MIPQQTNKANIINARLYAMLIVCNGNEPQTDWEKMYVNAVTRHYMAGMEAVSAELVEHLKIYGNHLSICSINQNWGEALQAMTDTPLEFRDEGYYEAMIEIEKKRNNCSCGFQQALDAHNF